MVFDRVSADGYYAASDGDLNWAVPEPELDKGAAGSLTTAGTMLFGRRTYDMFESFWPTAAGEGTTAPDPHAPGRRNPEMHAMAVWINESEKIVYSRTRQSVTWQNSRLVHDFDPREVAALKEQPGRGIMVFGSGSIASLLTEHDLVDEYQLIVNPVLLGGGQALLRGVSTARKLALIESTTYPSGNVKLRYRPSR
ncbi:MAG: dihydrofolate reductase family protein [Vicinamibacterales bacterium]